jgi:hypothetical protein
MDDTGGTTPPRRGSTSRFGIGLAFAVTVLVAVALAGPSVGVGLPCETGCTTDSTTTGGTTGGTINYILHITVSGSGSVSGTGSKTCSSSCSWTYADGTPVTVTAGAGTNGQSFTAWGGDCSGSAGCSVTMDQAHSVSASFADVTPPGPPTISAPTSGQVIQSATGTAGSANVSFTNPADAASNLCKIDSGVQTACTSGWNTGALSTGSHTASVWAKDAAGNISSAASVAFKVANRVAATIGGTPAASAITATKATSFTYGGGDKQQCSVDGGAFLDCAADVGSSLADGVHSIAVQAGTTLDATTYWGTSTTRSWTIDTHAPNTTLSSGPPAKTSDTSAVLVFSGADPAPGTAMHYECSIDGGAFAACTSPKTFTGLGVTSHTASVRAIDAAGNVDGSPATTSWTVVQDADGDGYNVPQDCNDNDPSIHPGAVDIPDDGIDQNCDGHDAVNLDRDGDGYNRPQDCNDNNAAIHPGAVDIPDDGIDQNCDGVDAVNLDRDGDGYNRPQDCNDSNAAIHPGAHDIPGNGIDEDCSGSDAALTRPGTSVLAAWGKVGNATFLPVFKISSVPHGGKVVVTCKGKGCKFKSTKVKLSKGKANLSKLMRKQHLGKGATVDVTTTVNEMLTYTIRFKVGKPGAVKTSKLCAKPGSKHTYSCG